MSDRKWRRKKRNKAIHAKTTAQVKEEGTQVKQLDGSLGRFARGKRKVGMGGKKRAVNGKIQ